MNSQEMRTAPIVSQPNLDAPQEHPETTIAKEATVSGSITGQGNLLIEGTIIGDIRLNGSVAVARTGVVRGPILADCVSVAGSVEGDITAKTRIQLEMTGSIQGDVTTCSFTIADGSYFNGRSHMTKPGEEPVFLY